MCGLWTECAHLPLGACLFDLFNLSTFRLFFLVTLQSLQSCLTLDFLDRDLWITRVMSFWGSREELAITSTQSPTATYNAPRDGVRPSSSVLLRGMAGSSLMTLLSSWRSCFRSLVGSSFSVLVFIECWSKQCTHKDLAFHVCNYILIKLIQLLHRNYGIVG